MNTEQERAAFEAWAASIGFSVTGKYAETLDVLCAESAFKAGYKAGRAAQPDAATTAPSDENGEHRLMEPDHETALALADAPRSLRDYVSALQAENERLLAERDALARDAERYRWLKKSAFCNVWARGDGIALVVPRTPTASIDSKIDAAMQRESGRRG